MKGIFRFIACALVLVCLAMPLSGLAVSAQDISISVQWTDGNGQVQYANPALPVTGAPEENRFWLQLPPDAPLDGLTLEISDLTGTLTNFFPSSGAMLGNIVMDAGGSLDGPFMEVTAFSASGQMSTFRVYFSYQEMPEESQPSLPVDVPVQPAQVTVHYMDEYGGAVLEDRTVTLEEGSHIVSAEAVEGYTLTSSDAYSVTVDQFGANPTDIYFMYTRQSVSANVTVHYVDEQGNALLQDQVMSFQEGAYMVSAQEISGYVLISAGSFNVTIDRNGPSPAEVTFVYARQVATAQVTVQYLDEQGAPLLPEETLTLQEGVQTVYARELGGYSLVSSESVSVTVDASGASPASVTFVYAREPITAQVTVRYQDDQGAALLKDQVLTLQEGENTVYAETIEGYTLASPESVSVTVDETGANPDSVTFVYALSPVSANVTVHYVNEAGQSLIPDVTYTYDRGPHTVSAPMINDYTVTGPDAYTVNVDQNGADLTDITFVYARIIYPAQVTVHYVTDGGQTLLPDETVTVEAGEHTLEAPATEGYVALEGGKAQVTVTADGAEPAEITFVYTREVFPVDVVVHYVDENGTPIAPDTPLTLQPGPGYVYPAAGLQPEDYLLTGPSFFEVNVTADGVEETEFTFTYQRVAKDAAITIHYVDDQGNMIAPDAFETLSPGIHSVFPSADISSDLYTLMEPVSFTVMVDVNGPSEKEITFTYQRVVQDVEITVHYVDDRGETIGADDVLTFGEGVHTVTPQKDFPAADYQQPEPASYELTVDVNGGSLTEATFTYRRAVKDAQVTVHYVDGEGSPLAEDSVLTFGEGTWGVWPQPQGLPEIYILRNEDQAFQNVTVTADGAEPAEITFVYERRLPSPVEVTVAYRDVDSGEEIIPAETVTIQGWEGLAVEPNAEKVPGDYELISAAVVNVTLNDRGKASPETVEFLYRKIVVETQAPTQQPEETAAPAEESVKVAIWYVDENGQQVADAAEMECAPGDTMVQCAPVNLKEGYELDSAEIINVHVENGAALPAEVTFTYRLAGEAPAPKVALVNVKYVNPNHEVFYSYSATCAQGQENRVDVDMTKVDPGWGYELDSEPSVYVTVDSAGNFEPQEVVFQFRNETNVNVPVRFRDQETGRDVATSKEVMCSIGENVVAAQPDDLEENYHLVGDSSVKVILSQDGTLNPAEVIFLYASAVTPAPTATTPAVDAVMDAWFYPTGSAIRVRTSPNTTEDNIIGLVGTKDLGHVLGRVTNKDGKVWYAVEINGMTGYMSESVIRFLNDAEMMAVFNYTAAPTELPTPAPTEIPDGAPIDRWGYTNAVVNFRKNADQKSGRIAELRKNSRVWILSSQTVNGEKWYNVLISGNNGYLKSEFVDMCSQAESDEIQRTLSSPAPTQIPPVTATDVPMFTEAPTEVPAQFPEETAEPVQTEEAAVAVPTESPAPYRGYALTLSQTALRTGVSQTDDSILQMLPAQSLLIVNSQTYVDGVAWASAQSASSGNLGFIPMSALLPINNEEARPYLDQILTTPEVTATPVPDQTTGYAMTLGDGVPMRNFPDTNGEIVMLLPYMAVADVRAQQYTESAAWHLVQYNGLWGYIRQDQLRMMSEEESAAYRESMAGGTPTPSPAPTPEPMTQTSLSSYGHVQSNSGKVNLRSEPTTTRENKIRMLDNYAFALVLGSVSNEEGLWYHVSQAGTEGYIRSDYFKVLSLAELSSFLTSSEYLNANSNNTSSSASVNQIQPVEDYNRTVWQNPNLSASYEPFNPFLTPTPDPERLPTETPAPTAQPTATPEIAPVGPADTNITEPVQQGGSPWPWVLLGLAVAGGGGAYYAFTVHQQNKRRQAIRAQQAQQARREAAARQPQTRPAQNNPGQTVNRASYPPQNAAPFMPPQGGAPRPAQPNGVTQQSTKIYPNNEPQEASGYTQSYPSMNQQTMAYPPIRQQTQVYRPAQIRPQAQPLEGMNTEEAAALAKDAKGFQPTAESAQGLNLNIRVDRPGLEDRSGRVQNAPQVPVQSAQGVKFDIKTAEQAPAKQPEQQPAPAEQTGGETPRRRVRRTERNKDLYDKNDQA